MSTALEREGWHYRAGAMLRGPVCGRRRRIATGVPIRAAAATASSVMAAEAVKQHAALGAVELARCVRAAMRSRSETVVAARWRLASLLEI